MKKKMKLLLALSVTLLAVCAVYLVREYKSLYEWPYTGHTYLGFFSDWRMNFDEAVEASDCAAIAKYVSSRKYRNGKVELTFEIVEVLRGDISEERILLEDWRTYKPVAFGLFHIFKKSQFDYRKGSEYILVMNKGSLYYGYSFYTLTRNEIYIPMDYPDESTIMGRPLFDKFDGESIDEIKARIKEIEAPSPKERLIAADDLPTIIKESDLVLEVKVIGVFIEGIHYTCEVIDVLKGELGATYEDGTIPLTMFIGQPRDGEPFIVTANQKDKELTYYAQSAKNGIIPITDTEAVSEVRRLIAEA